MSMQIIKSKSWCATGNHFFCKVLPCLFHLAASQSRSLSTQFPVSGKERRSCCQHSSQQGEGAGGWLMSTITSSTLACASTRLYICAAGRGRGTGVLWWLKNHFRFQRKFAGPSGGKSKTSYRAGLDSILLYRLCRDHVLFSPLTLPSTAEVSGFA